LSDLNLRDPSLSSEIGGKIDIIDFKWTNNRFSEGTTEIPAKPFFQNSGKIAGPSVSVAADEENQISSKIPVIT
jgi:hypothetical protein